MSKKTFFQSTVSVFILLTAFMMFSFQAAFAQDTDSIAITKDVILGYPIQNADELPDQISFSLYESKDAVTPMAVQNFVRGEYTIDFDFSKTDGLSSGSVARLTVNFTNKLDLENAVDTSGKPKEIWAELSIQDEVVGNREKLSDEAMVKLLLASDASIATYLTLAYQGDGDPITTIYRDLPINSLTSEGSSSTLGTLFTAIPLAATSTREDYWAGSGGSGQIYYNGGNVGIGADNPVNPLQVSLGGGQYSALPNGFHMGIDGVGNTHMELVTNAGTPYIDFLNDNTSDYDARIILMGDDMLSINGAMVGIGTDSPVNPLQVSATGGAYENLPDGFHMGIDGVGNTHMELVTNNGTPYIDFLNSNTSDYNGRIILMGDGDLRVEGVTNFRVNGKIACRELEVTTAAWADFVFDDNYQIPSIQEVDRFIKENKHLPGIPSESEVKKNGINVADMSTKLLQKVEELTLYVIDLNRENDLLKKQIESVKGEVRNRIR